MHSLRSSILMCTVCVCFFASFSSAATLNVPQDFAAIQDAIIFAQPGDTVVVAQGTYKEHLDFLGKNITVTSTAPGDWTVTANTIIDAGGTGSAVTFKNNEGPEAVLKGFTITGGYGTIEPSLSPEIYWGGGIFCISASPTITLNFVKANIGPASDAVPGFGGGIGCFNSNAVITRNVISQNQAYIGGGVLAYIGQAIIANNIIAGNLATGGGGAALIGGELINNTISNNTAGVGGNVYVVGQQGLPVKMINNIIVNASSGGGIYCEQFNPYITIACNDVWNNAGGDYYSFNDLTGSNGNISANPGFTDYYYHISAESPCFEAGQDSFVPYSWQRDIDGEYAVMGLRPDIGADEVFGNVRPIAVAGPDQVFAEIPAIVVFDASASYDPDSNNILSYTWTQTAGPAVDLVNADSTAPSFAPIAEDIYKFELTVNDGELNSAGDEILVIIGNSPPVADAGADKCVLLGTQTTLDGTGSFDPDLTGALSYTWSQVAGPNVILQNSEGPQPFFDCAQPGVYVFELVVSDGFKQSQPDSVKIVTTDISADVQQYDFRNIGTYAHYGDLSGNKVFFGVGNACDYTWNYRCRDLQTGSVSSQTFKLIQPKVDGDLLVWFRYGTAFNNPWEHEPCTSAVFVRNVATGVQKTLRNWTWTDSYGHPVISGKKIVWMEHHGLNLNPDSSGNPKNWWDTPFSICGADVSNWNNPVYFTVANNAGKHDPYPCHTYDSDFDDVVDICGNLVVWEGNGNIYGADISNINNIEPFVICDAPGRQYDPAVSDGIVVWTDERHDEGDIYGANISDRDNIKIFELIKRPGMQNQAAIDGLLMVYVDGGLYSGNIKVSCITKAHGAIDIPLGKNYTGVGPAIDGHNVIWQSALYGEALGIRLNVSYSIADGAVENVDTLKRYDYIQFAIDEAQPGNTIAAQPGRYRENIRFNGKNLTLESQQAADGQGAASTIIQGLGDAPVVAFQGTENETCVLDGFTIEGGNAPFPGGGGIYGGASGAATPTIRNCIIQNNLASDYGGAIGGVKGLISNCVIRNNKAKYGGGLSWCDGVIKNCLIVNNTATTAGNALYRCNGQIINCTIVSDSNLEINQVGACAGNFVNCILDGQNNDFDACTGAVSYCCYPSASSTGNISCEPLFADPVNGNYRLVADSNCINAGDPLYTPVEGETDLDGRPRIIASAVDMGAFEYNHTPAANAGPDQTFYAWIDGSATVRLNGKESSDFEGYTLDYYWYNDANELIAEGLEADIVLPVGKHTIKLIVTDGIDDSQPDSCNINVVGAVQTDAKLLANLLNIKSSRPLLIGRIEFAGIEKPDIDIAAKMLLVHENTTFEAKLQRLSYSATDNEWYLFGYFELPAQISSLPAGTSVKLTLAAQFTSGQWVYGSDGLKVK